MTWPRRALRVLAVSLTLTLAACGTSRDYRPTTISSSTVDTTSTPTLPLPPVPPLPATPTPTAPGVTMCPTEQLGATVQPVEAAAGTRYATLILTNNSPQPCTLYGYADLQLLGHDGVTRIPTDLRRDPSMPPTLVLLARGAAALADLHWSAVSTGSEPIDEPCQPEAARTAVSPPGQARSLTARWFLGPVCDAGKITIGPFRPSAPHQPTRTGRTT